jgi:hypothetical protein
MIYKGYEITKQFLPGSNFKIREDGNVVDRKPTNADIDFYCTEHRKTGEQLPNSLSIDEAKEFIRKMVSYD